MKKSLFLFAVLLLGVLAITSCDSNDDDAPVVTPVVVSHGAFVACAGNMASHISGSLSYYDYKASSVTNNAFLQANGRQLGGTVNDGLAYGGKIYLVATDENSIEVVDKTLHSIHHISTTALLGNADGKSPRHLAADGGRIYFTTYGGYVGAIDTTSFALQDKFKVGSYPEGVTIANGRIFVASSDYGNGNGSISEINMASQQVIDHKISDIVNPQKVYVVRGNI